MSETIAFLQQGLLLVVWLTLPPLAVAVVVGVVVSLIQTVLSIQDQALPFAVKLLAVGLALALVGRWQGQQLLALGDQALRSVATITHKNPVREPEPATHSSPLTDAGTAEAGRNQSSE